MATIKNVLKETNPLSQMRDMSGDTYISRMGDPVIMPDVTFNPTQRISNQLKTASQVMNYSASKEMAEQGRTDMRGNVLGYSDTVG